MKSMIGAIIGDIVGSTYEFNNTRDYNFKLFPKGSTFTDDTICTVAIADAILRGIPYKDSLVEWGRRYPEKRDMFGTAFGRWIYEDPTPYNSYGNGAAMRVSPIGYVPPGVQNLDICLEAKKSAECSHSHPEGIEGARFIAIAVNDLLYLPQEIAPGAVLESCSYSYKNFDSTHGTNLPKKGEFDMTCQGCVPLAVYLFLHSQSFEEAIRRAVFYGGDSDTLAAIVGSLAGAYFDIPDDMVNKARSYLPKEITDVIDKFDGKFVKGNYLINPTYANFHENEERAGREGLYKKMER